MNLFKHLLGLRRLPFVRDVLTVQAGTFVFMFASFFASIAFARFLGKDAYGTYAVILAFTGTVTTFFNIGQGQSLYVFFAEAFGKKDRDAMAAVLANFFMIATVNMLLLLLVAWWMPFLSEKLYGDSSIGKLASLLCLFQISEIWNGMTNILLQSVRRIRLKVIMEQSANLSYLGCAIVVLLLGGGVRGVILTQLIVSLVFLPISLIVLAVIAKKDNLPGVREALRVPLQTSSQYLVQGLLITADKTIGNFFPQGLFFLFSLFSPASFIGVAKISMQIASIPRSIFLPQAGDLSTAAFASMMVKSNQDVRINAAKLIKHALALHALLSLGAAILSPFVIMHFYGPEYWDAIPLTLWLLPVFLLNSFTIINAPILRLYRKIHWSMIINTTSWVVMGLCLLLVKGGLSPFYGFILSCAAFYGVPIVVTIHIFHTLLKGNYSEKR